MQIEAHLDAETIERLEEQSELLLRMYRAGFAKDQPAWPQNPPAAI